MFAEFNQKICFSLIMRYHSAPDLLKCCLIKKKSRKQLFVIKKISDAKIQIFNDLLIKIRSAHW